MKKYYPYPCNILLLTLFVLSARSQVNVLTQHNDLKRTGWNQNERVLNQTNVNSSTFGKIFTRTVDDQIYAQPLVLSNLAIKGKLHNVVFVATVNNSLYAFDAESDTANTPLWKVNLTFPGYRSIKNTDMTGACFGFYKDFSGNMGIVGTPVIDTVTNTLYVVARSVSTDGTKTFVQYLHAIDLRTGTEKNGSPVYITATVDGNGDGSVNGKITFNQQKQNQRPGLLLYKGVVYIGWASHCDWSPYHGWILGYDARTLQLKYTYNATPEGGLAGIWMSGQAPAVDDKGFIYVSTGNGTVGQNGNPNDTINRGESILKLSTSTGNLKVVDFFTPNNYPELERGDLDYGVDGVLLIPKTSFSISGSKESKLYLIDNNNMGGTTTDNSNAREIININPEAGGDHHLHGSPVYYVSPNKKEFIYAWCEGGLLKQIPFNRASKLFDTAHTITGQSNLPAGMPGAMLAVSSNGLKSRTGILWASHPLSGDANHKTVQGVLQAFAADDVTHELWNSNQNPGRDSIGNFAKFVCPTVANGKVYLATFSNKLDVYGILPAPVVQSSNANAVVSVNNNYSFDIFPNPAKQNLTIKYNDNLGAEQQITIKLINSVGETVYNENLIASKNGITHTINLSSPVKDGLYITEIINSKGNIITKKLVIKN